MTLLGLLFALALAAFAIRRLRTYLHAFQQEEYDFPRLCSWWKEKKAWDRWATLGLAISIPFAWLQPQVPLLAGAAWLGWRAWKEPNPAYSPKKPLVVTTRARNILVGASLLAVLAAAPPALLAPPPWQVALGIALIQLLPVALGLANYALLPLNTLANRRYLKEAHAILARLTPTTVALTGSFGKTSTKYILNHLLATHAPTLMTPGSVNTPLGIARIVREQLQPHHHYFLAEMGAYGPGSIARLCKLAPPAISCITAVGEAHYERFKSLETVARAKFEIAEATHARGGLCLLAVDGIPEALWRPRVESNPTGYKLVGGNAQHLREGDYLIRKAEQTPQGLTLTITHHKEDTTFHTPIFGPAQVSNLALSFAMAVELGLSKKSLAAAFARVPAAPHRLNVQRQGASTLIDDSYNANPTGFASALEVLTLIAHGQQGKGGKPGQKRRRILITPGMVELGAKHDEEHARLGALAGQNADIILAINPSRIPTFLAAAMKHVETTVIPLPTLADARAWLAAHGKADDVILIENDLPERYESTWTL